MAGDGGRVPDVSEQRAVARAIYSQYSEPHERHLAHAVEVIEALDRVRDARGDDGGRVRIPPLCDRCGGDHYITEHDAPAARSPQGEDHEAGNQNDERRH